MVLLITYLLIALLFSFLCSLLEAVLLSITPSYITIKLKEGNEEGKALQKMKENVDRPLAAILTLNTFAHTIGAAGVGAQAQKIWGEEYLSIISAILTIIILVFSELIPKTLGANNWKQLTPFTIKTLRILMYSPLYPIILLSQVITKTLKKDKRKSVLSRADFAAIAELGIKEGLFKEAESKILNSLIRFNNFTVDKIMTKKEHVVAAPGNMSIGDYYKNNIDRLQFSRIPVYEGSMEHISGYVLKWEVLSYVLNGKGNEPLKNITRELIKVQATMTIPELQKHMVDKKEHIAMVRDEKGGLSGIVTLEDIIEILIGMEIWDEKDFDLETQPQPESSPVL